MNKHSIAPIHLTAKRCKLCTPCLTANSQSLFKHSIQTSRFYAALKLGGGERDRTDDPLLAKQVLSQLSYTPRCFLQLLQTNGGSGWARTIDPRLIKTVL